MDAMVKRRERDWQSELTTEEQHEYWRLGQRLLELQRDLIDATLRVQRRDSRRAETRQIETKIQNVRAARYRIQNAATARAGRSAGR